MPRAALQPEFRAPPTEPFVLTGGVKRRAITAHEAELDRVLASLLFDGGMFSVQVAVAEGVKRLAMKHRDQLSTEGWVI